MSDEELDPTSRPKPPPMYIIDVRSAPDLPASPKLFTVDKGDPTSIADWLNYHHAMVDWHIEGAIAEARQAGRLLNFARGKLGKSWSETHTEVRGRQATQYLDLEKTLSESPVKLAYAVQVAFKSILHLAKKPLASKSTLPRGGTPRKPG